MSAALMRRWRASPRCASLVARARPVLGALALALTFTLAPDTARADGPWQAMQRPGAVALIRHALAPGTGDPANFQVDDCTTQRNLNDRGRAQARAIGAAFRQNAIAVDRVLSSRWCRCLETAELLDLAPVEEYAPLNSFFEARAKGPGQTEELRAFLAARPAAERLVLVTHQVNITALTGRPVSSGEIIVVDVDTSGAVEVLAEIWLRP